MRFMYSTILIRSANALNDSHLCTTYFDVGAFYDNVQRGADASLNLHGISFAPKSDKFFDNYRQVWYERVKLESECLSNIVSD